MIKSNFYSAIIKLLKSGSENAAFEMLRGIEDIPKGIFENKLYEKILKLMPNYGYHLDLVPRFLPSGANWPKISVVTPSYNQGKYIEETIVSVLSQNYPNLEYIIIDGGSSDDTVNIIKKYSSKINYFISEKDKGQSDALNKGFKVAQGEIFCWLNSDDQFAPNALFSVALAFFNSKADIVAGICEVYENDVLRNKHMTSCEEGILPLMNLLDLDNGWNAGQFFYQPEVFFTKDLWNRAGGYVREDYFYSMDYDLWCRFAYERANLHVIGASLAKFRTHEEQKTSQTDKFKEELIKVRDKIISAKNIIVPNNENDKLRVNNDGLKIIFLNDNGFNYGAGIAHQRIYSAFEMAGHRLELFELPSEKNLNYKNLSDDLISKITNIDPDFILFGNCHAKCSTDIGLISKIFDIAPVYWVTHDFWLLTGRCAYPSGCDKYLNFSCDENCPTANEYPILDPNKIKFQLKNKIEKLVRHENLNIFANSSWSGNKYSNYFNLIKNSEQNIFNIRLGVPTRIYKKTNKNISKRDFGIGVNDFVIAFSVSSLSEKRKGANFLFDALRNFNHDNVVLIVIGNSDVDINLDGARIIKMGYISDSQVIVDALSAADLYVGPSTEETFGQVFIEAASVGTPSLGFLGSGVEDAIIDSVTGWLVPPTVSDLKNKLEYLYQNKRLLKDVSFYSSIYANNEFSLEALYRTFFIALEKKLILKNKLVPRKINFSKVSQYAEPVSNNFKWIASSGFSNREGPYPPDYNFAFHWAFSSESIVKIQIVDGQNKIRVHAASPIFTDLKVQLMIGNVEYGVIDFNADHSSKIIEFGFEISLVRGWYDLIFKPSHHLDATESESRPLSFMLIDVCDGA